MIQNTESSTTVHCDTDGCETKTEYPHAALMAGGIRALGWVPLGCNKHRCPVCASGKGKPA